MNVIKNILARIFALWALVVFAGTLLIIILPAWLISFQSEPKRTISLFKIFIVWMKAFFVLTGVRRIFKGKEKPRGKSTLNKWICPDCGLAVRMGIKSDPKLVHDVCSEIKGQKVFLIRDDGRSHTIYKAK